MYGLYDSDIKAIMNLRLAVPDETNSEAEFLKVSVVTCVS